MGSSSQENWSGLPFFSPGDLPHPGIKYESPALQADSGASEPPRKPTSRRAEHPSGPPQLGFQVPLPGWGKSLPMALEPALLCPRPQFSQLSDGMKPVLCEPGGWSPPFTTRPPHLFPAQTPNPCVVKPSDVSSASHSATPKLIPRHYRDKLSLLLCLF